MKKVFLIFGMAGCLSLFSGINYANAVQSELVVVNVSCPEGCRLEYETVTLDGYGSTIARCLPIKEGAKCGDPAYSISSSAMSAATVEPNTIKSKRLNKASVRVAQTPKMVKKIVYEQVVEDEE